MSGKAVKINFRKYKYFSIYILNIVSCISTFIESRGVYSGGNARNQHVLYRTCWRNAIVPSPNMIRAREDRFGIKNMHMQGVYPISIPNFTISVLVRNRIKVIYNYYYYYYVLYLLLLFSFSGWFISIMDRKKSTPNKAKVRFSNYKICYLLMLKKKIQWEL